MPIFLTAVLKLLLLDYNRYFFNDFPDMNCPTSFDFFFCVFCKNFKTSADMKWHLIKKQKDIWRFSMLLEWPQLQKSLPLSMKTIQTNTTKFKDHVWRKRAIAMSNPCGIARFSNEMIPTFSFNTFELLIIRETVLRSTFALEWKQKTNKRTDGRFLLVDYGLGEWTSGRK